MHPNPGYATAWAASGLTGSQGLTPTFALPSLSSLSTPVDPANGLLMPFQPGARWHRHVPKSDSGPVVLEPEPGEFFTAH